MVPWNIVHWLLLSSTNLFGLAVLWLLSKSGRTSWASFHFSAGVGIFMIAVLGLLIRCDNFLPVVASGGLFDATRQRPAVDWSGLLDSDTFIIDFFLFVFGAGPGGSLGLLIGSLANKWLFRSTPLIVTAAQTLLFELQLKLIICTSVIGWLLFLPFFIAVVVLRTPF